MTIKLVLFLGRNSAKTFFWIKELKGHPKRRLVRASCMNQPQVFVEDFKMFGNFQKEGAKTAEHPSEVAEKCSEIITMLPTKVEVKETYCGDNGILQYFLHLSLTIYGLARHALPLALNLGSVSREKHGSEQNCSPQMQ